MLPEITTIPIWRSSYDSAGNKETERDANGLVTSYTYYPRNWVKTVSQNGEVKEKYYYNKKGDLIKTEDALGHITQYEYDSLGRVRTVKHLLNQENFGYDSVGNRIWAEDGRRKRTNYTYNGLGWLTAVRDPLGNSVSYRYDPNGNRVAEISAKGLVTVYRYDELNRLVERIDSLGNTTSYGYDLNGNRVKMTDPNQTVWEYGYYGNNLLQKLVLTGADGSTYYVTYTYDAAGNRKAVTDSTGHDLFYNMRGETYYPDPLNRLTSIERKIDGQVYRTEYRYEQPTLLTGIKYPESASWVTYKYNALSQLTEVVGFTGPQGITYDKNGAVRGVSYANGAAASYTYDQNRRLDNLRVELGGQEILKLDYGYDLANNITRINEKTYEYDEKNQLTQAYTPGRFLEEDPTPGTPGRRSADLLGASWLDFGAEPEAVVSLDYDSSSIGLYFGTVAPRIKKIVLTPDKEHQAHRFTARTLDLYTSADNLTYTVVPRESWEFQKSEDGTITLTMKETLSARYLKVHLLFDDRDLEFNPVNKATFLNQLARMIKVYQEATSRTESYEYDADGNRINMVLQLVQTFNYQSEYYPNSNRLKTDGKYLYTYDNNGNLTGKERVDPAGDEPAEEWEYRYDLLNRLTMVVKNGKVVSEYGYDPEGFRVVKRAHGETTHYVFEGMEPIFEKKISAGGSVKVRSYVYALGKHLARVDGVIGDPEAKVYFYHTDHLGSVRAVTDETGEVVWNADYLAFGTRFGAPADSAFEEWHGFTGKEYDPDSGLIYYGARWMDPELGRFISEDPAADPNNPNLYSYCGNNPINRIDSTGYFFDELGNWLSGKGWRESTEEEKEERRRKREEKREAELRDTYGDEEAERILEAEKNIPGFRFDTFDAGRGLTLENQIQLHLTMSALEDKLKADGSLSTIDKVKLNLAREELTTAFDWLNKKSSVINLFADKASKWGPYYTADQIDEALLEVGLAQSAAVIGAISLAPGLQVIEGTASTAKVFGPMNKGPLPDAVANTFRSGTYTKIVTQGETTLYRAYGGKAGELGSYWTTIKPQGPLQSVIDSALDQNWGNTATNISTIKVPQGTTIYQGYAAQQGGLVGGGVQVYIPEVDPSWLVK